jgi:hypothetical protein
MTLQTDDHADKYNDPRAKLSRRGVLLGIGVVLFGMVGAGLSIWARRTHLRESTIFWGPDVIEAFQLAEEVELMVTPEPSGPQVDPVRLSGMPGLGHLRHVLLDDRSYDWESLKQEPISEGDRSADRMVLRFTDPTAKRFPQAEIVIDLETGWVGDQRGQQQVRLNERFRVALPLFLKRIANYEPLRAEMREE